MRDIILKSHPALASERYARLAESYIRSLLEDGARLTQGARPSLYASCFAACALRLLNVPSHDLTLKALASSIRAAQRADGHFYEDSIAENAQDIITHQAVSKKKRGVRVGKQGVHRTHSATYCRSQLTDFCLLALKDIGVKPRYDPKPLKLLQSPAKMHRWLSGLDWGNPWLASNQVMFTLNAFLLKKGRPSEKQREIIETAFQWIEHHQDPKSGLWLGKSASLHNRMAATYHLLFYLTYHGRSIRYAERIIDSVLVLQQRDGLFDPSGAGGSCSDIDAIDLLCRCSRITNHRAHDVRRACLRSYAALLAKQNADGGFCWSTRSHSPVVRIPPNGLLLHPRALLSDARSKVKTVAFVMLGQPFSWKMSGLEQHAVAMESSDLFSTWFRLCALASIERRFTELSRNSGISWRSPERCGLGCLP